MRSFYRLQKLINYSILHNAHALARTGMKIQGNHFARIGCETKTTTPHNAYAHEIV